MEDRKWRVNMVRSCETLAARRKLWFTVFGFGVLDGFGVCFEKRGFLHLDAKEGSFEREMEVCIFAAELFRKSFLHPGLQALPFSGRH